MSISCYFGSIFGENNDISIHFFTEVFMANCCTIQVHTDGGLRAGGLRAGARLSCVKLPTVKA